MAAGFMNRSVGDNRRSSVVVPIGCSLIFICLAIGIINQHAALADRTCAAYRTIFILFFSIPIQLLKYIWRTLVVLVLVSFFLWHTMGYAHERRKAARKIRYESALPVHLKLAFSQGPDNYFVRLQESRPPPFVYPESEMIEKELTETLELMLVQFLHSWYSNISYKPLFPRLVEKLIRTALINLKDRLLSIDLVGVIVRTSVPLITQHLHEFTVAESQVRESMQIVQIDAMEHNSICERFAQNCDTGKLHPAAQTSTYDADHVITPENKLQSYLRTVVEKLLPNLLPAPELASSIVRTLLREIVSCAVVQPIFVLLSDPDFWNQMIVTQAHEAIQERARVKRFRSVLKEQTRHPLSQKKTMKKKPMRNLERLMLSNDAKDWDRLYRKIRKSQSLVDVSRMRNEMMILRNEMIAANHLTDDCPREGRGGLSQSERYVTKAASLLQSRMAYLSYNGKVPSPTTAPSGISFDTMLAIGVSYFFDFMERRDRVDLLDFWQRIIQVKLLSTEPLPNSQLQILDADVQLSKEEIAILYMKYFDSPLLAVSSEEKNRVRNYLEQPETYYDYDSNTIVTAIARRAYRIMETDDFPSFKHDSSYFNMITSREDDDSSIVPGVTRSSSSSALSALLPGRNIMRLSRADTNQSVDLGSEYLAPEPIPHVDSEKAVLAALEDALHDVLVPEYSQSYADGDSTPPTYCSQVDPRRASSPAQRASDSPSEPHRVIRRIDVPSDIEVTITDLKTPEPGDLSLVEQIEVLDKEISKRQTSIGYIDSFLKRDIDEIDRRTALKSRKETARELESLLGQKKQYEYDDHSLFGRTSLRIDHAMTHKDAEGNDYTVYMIEVQRTGPDGIEAGWIITRRYSEFNELLSQLKTPFPYVAHLDFPKKQLNRLKSVAEVRRPILEAFLRNLLKDERICRSRELRTFLSQNNETVKKRQHKSVMENLIGLTDPREALSRLFTLLEGHEEVGVRSPGNPDLRDVHPAPHDLHNDEVSSFAKPIVDLVLEAFELKEKSKWIKKKAVVLVLQQLLGGTIESRVRDQMGAIVEERSFAGILAGLKAQLMSLSDREPQKVRTKAEKQRLVELASQTLRAYNPSYIPDTAAKKVLRALQIRTLNQHLLGKLMDQLVDAIF